MIEPEQNALGTYDMVKGLRPTAPTGGKTDQATQNETNTKDRVIQKMGNDMKRKGGYPNTLGPGQGNGNKPFSNSLKMIDTRIENINSQITSLNILHNIKQEKINKTKGQLQEVDANLRGTTRQKEINNMLTPANNSHQNFYEKGVNTFNQKIGNMTKKFGSFFELHEDKHVGSGIDPKALFQDGSGIHIKEKNKGKFTAEAKKHGEGVQEHAHHVVNDPDSELQRKRAQFAINAKKWKK